MTRSVARPRATPTRRLPAAATTSDRTAGEPPAGAPSLLDLVNRPAWSDERVAAVYRQLGSSLDTEMWTDPGERAAILGIASEVRNRRTLDLGVGSGRTIPMMRLLTDDYVGIDYTPAMLELCRAHFPGVDLRLGDARELRDFDDASFGFVDFSFNGIDAVDHLGRERVLGEVARVLEPGGHFVYSTHNKRGPCFRALPWRPAGSWASESWSLARRLDRAIATLLVAPVRLPRSVRNWWRLRDAGFDEDSWGISTVEAHDFGLLVHFTTMRGIISELTSHGLVPAAVYDAEHGRELDQSIEHPAVRYFHVVARRAT